MHLLAGGRLWNICPCPFTTQHNCKAIVSLGTQKRSLKPPILEIPNLSKLVHIFRHDVANSKDAVGAWWIHIYLHILLVLIQLSFCLGGLFRRCMGFRRGWSWLQVRVFILPSYDRTDDDEGLLWEVWFSTPPKQGGNCKGRSSLLFHCRCNSRRCCRCTYSQLKRQSQATKYQKHNATSASVLACTNTNTNTNTNGA